MLIIPRKSNQCETKTVSKQPLTGFPQYYYSEENWKIARKTSVLDYILVRLNNFEMQILQNHANLVKKTRSCMFHPVHSATSLNKYRSSRSQMFFKIGVLKKFAHFTRKHLCWSLFLITLQTWKETAFLWKLRNF